MWIVLVSGEFPLSSWFCRTFSMQDECDWICFSLTAENIPGIKWIIEMNLKPLTRSRCVQVKLKKRSCGCFSDMLEETVHVSWSCLVPVDLRPSQSSSVTDSSRLVAWVTFPPSGFSSCRDGRVHGTRCPVLHETQQAFLCNAPGALLASWFCSASPCQHRTENLSPNVWCLSTASWWTSSAHTVILHPWCKNTQTVQERLIRNKLSIISLPYL